MIYSAIQDFSLNFLAANAFAVSPSSISLNSIKFQFDYTTSMWSKIRINFWAGSNPQVQLGNFRVGTHQLI